MHIRGLRRTLIPTLATVLIGVLLLRVVGSNVGGFCVGCPWRISLYRSKLLSWLTNHAFCGVRDVRLVVLTHDYQNRPAVGVVVGFGRIVTLLDLPPRVYRWFSQRPLAYRHSV